MKTIWILVCDAARGRLFEVGHGDPSWREIERFERSPCRDDASSQSSPSDLARAFAHDLTAMLDASVRSQRLQRLVLVAPAPFLGILGDALTPELHRRLVTTLDRDLTHLAPELLAERLRHLARMTPDGLAAHPTEGRPSER